MKAEEMKSCGSRCLSCELKTNKYWEIMDYPFIPIHTSNWPAHGDFIPCGYHLSVDIDLSLSVRMDVLKNGRPMHVMVRIEWITFKLQYFTLISFDE